MEKNTTNYKFLNAKDRAAERKRSSSVMDTDRYHYKTAPHVQTGKRKRDSDGFFTPYAMFRPYSGTGLLCAIFGETPARKTSDLRVTQDMLAKEAYEHEVELLMCHIRASEIWMQQEFCKEEQAMELYQKSKIQNMPKLTPDGKRKILLDALTWKYDCVQQYKKICFQFAEAVIAREKSQNLGNANREHFIEQFIKKANELPEANRRLLDLLYETAWHTIYVFKYGTAPEKVPAPWYDRMGGVEK